MRVESHHFEVGILKDGPHKKARPKSQGFKNLAKGPARKSTSKRSKISLSRLMAIIKGRFKIDLLRRPFKTKRNKEIRNFANGFLRSVMNNRTLADKRRMENLVQAIVRNPIARGDYGVNKASTARGKGFNRLFIDTGQLFNGLKARLVKSRMR